ncbi:MAG: Omp28-related outer membrane protein, partial [Bacteroidales bacterium]|nr:Omp28-related outer membrane protein [Bacteroidales bacterium]
TASYPEKVKVMISTTGTNKTDFTQVLDVVMDDQNYSTGWNTVMVNLDSYAGQNIYIAFVNHGDGYYTFVDDVEVKVIPANGISAVSAAAPAYTSQGGLCNVSLTVRNEGSAPLAAFDIAYSVNGGDEQNLSVAGIDVAPFTTHTCTVPVQVLDLGVALINLTVSNPNNDTDPDATDNSTSCETNVYDPSTTTLHNTVLEHFTTARCPNCPPAHERLEAAVNGQEDRVVWIAHHVGYYTDDMTITESNQMLRFFNDGGSTYAPAIMLDRNQAFVTDNDPGPVFFPGEDVAQVISNAISTPAYVSVNISDVNYDAQSRQLSLTVNGSFMSDMTFDSPRITVYIMQDHIMGTQSGASGQYEHNHVIRACVTDVWGDATAITSTTAGSTFSKTFTYTLPTNFKANNCWAAAFVNNYTSNVNNCRIANATKTGYLLEGTDPTAGIGDVQANMKVVTYPNPTTEMAYVTTESTIRSYEMVDALGRKVMGSENVNADILELNVSSLSAGIYFITVTTDLGTATQRLNVTK